MDRVEPDSLDDPRGWLRGEPSISASPRPAGSHEDRLDALERKVRSLEEDVARNSARRTLDEPAIEFADWRRRQFEIGRVILPIVGAFTLLIALSTTCGRR